MAEVFTCPMGHRWTVSVREHALRNDIWRCPFCESAAIESAVTPVADDLHTEIDPGWPSTPGLPAPHPIPPPVHAALDLIISRSGGGASGDIASRLPELPGYELISQLGRGGMGVVWLARQTHLDRLVAVKQIAHGLAGDPEALLRFQREARSAAQLQHPNIVRVYEVGEYEGQPYLTLEYVDGGSLAQRLRREIVSYRDAAEWTRQLAEAIAFAHSQGVVHRDLKPSNILLTATGTPKISDFGSARWEGESGGQASSLWTMATVGTPAYMPPEQSRGVSHPSSDIYGLVRCLYEMLSGRPPFRGETPMETLRQLTNDDPVRPSRLAPRLPRDLETICLKCLEKDPARRYVSAAALADELSRYLRGEPIEARSIGRAARAIKWARRRPAAAALLMLTIAAAIGTVLGVGLYQRTLLNAWQREMGLKDAAEIARAEADRKRREAEANLNLFRDAIDRYYSRISDDPRLDDEALAPLRRELLESARDFYQTLVLESGGDAVSEATLARAYWRLARMESEIGTTEQRADACPGARDPAASSLPARPARRFRTRSRRELGARRNACFAARRRRRSRRAVRASPADARVARRPESRRPAVSSRASDRASQLGLALQRHGDRDRAAASYEQLLRLGERSQQEFFSSLEGRRILAVGHNNLGAFCRAVGRLEEARTHLEQAIAIKESLADENPDVVSFKRDLGVGHQNLGNVLQSLGDFPAAEAAYRSAAAIRSDLATAYPHRKTYVQDYAASLNALGIVHHRLGDLTPAEDELRRGLGIRKELLEREPELPDLKAQVASSLHNLGILYESTDRLAEAESQFRLALEIDLQLVADHPRTPAFSMDLIDNFVSLADLCRVAGRFDESLMWAARVNETTSSMPERAQQDPRIRQGVLRAAAGRAETLAELGQFDASLAAWNEALNVAETLPRGGDWRPALLLGHAAVLAKSGRFEEAIQVIDQALPAEGTPTGSLAYAAACAYASVAAAPHDAPELRAQSVEAADHAIKCLQAALESPEFRRSPRLTRLWAASSLDPLRSRSDFPALKAH